MKRLPFREGAARNQIGQFVPGIILLNVTMPRVDEVAFPKEIWDQPHTHYLTYSRISSVSEVQALPRAALVYFGI